MLAIVWIVNQCVVLHLRRLYETNQSLAQRINAAKQDAFGKR